ncbi:MAG: hypothetical protein LBN22_02215 [Clostridiales Family XIII bacterium]|jgi:hypothetical protein|nr:hypothetical protein [Clostridiales Family XIII bacterium]
MERKYTTKYAIAIIIAMVLALMPLLTSCGSKEGDSPKTVTKEFLEAIRHGDTANFADYYVISPGAFNFTDRGGIIVGDIDHKLAEEMYDRLTTFEYKIGAESISKSGDKATVKVSLKTYAYGNAVKAAVGEIAEEVMAKERISETHDTDGTTAIYTKYINSTNRDYEVKDDLKLVKVDGRWKVDTMTLSDPFVDDFTGGLVSATKAINEIFGAYE